ncbi:MAG TPA: hypothetical protein VE570_02905 [Thermoleophilaceae bacterium]|nr:hypothetical protein [Thermoleophilaceae bacterium]
MLVALLVAAPAAAAAPWSDSASLPGGGEGLMGAPALAFSPTGLGFLTTWGSGGWTQGIPIVKDKPLAARPLAAPPTPWAFIGRREIVAVTSVQRDRGRDLLQVGLATPGKRLRSVQTLAVGRTPSFDLDATTRGTAAVAFTRHGHLYLAMRSPGARRFARPIAVSGRAPVLPDPAVRVNGRGDVLLAWTAPEPDRSPASPAYVMMARIVRADGRLSRLWRLGASNAHAGFAPAPSLAFTRNRRALVGWQSGESTRVARVAYASGGGRFQPTQPLETFEQPVSSDFQSEPQIRVAFGSDGRGVAVWTGCCATTRAVRAAPLAGARFGPAQTLSQPGGDANVSSLATGPRRELVTSWTEGPVSAPRVVAAVLGRGAAQWGPAELVADQAADAQLAIDPVTRVVFAAFYPVPVTTGPLYATREPLS